MAIEDIRGALRTPSKSTSQSNVPDLPRDESPSARIERLGRERPSAFPNPWTELCCLFGIVMSQFLTEFFVSGFTAILPPLAQDLKIPQASQVWPATAFSLVISSTWLIFGRLGDIWGGYPLFFAGLAWLLIWSVVAGFSSGAVMLNICRALQGLGAAAFLPNGVMIIGSLYRPGPRKNLVFAGRSRLLWWHCHCRGRGSMFTLELLLLDRRCTGSDLARHSNLCDAVIDSGQRLP